MRPATSAKWLRCVEYAPGNLFLVFSGDDAVALLMALGGVGVISVASNEIPREMADLHARPR